MSSLFIGTAASYVLLCRISPSENSCCCPTSTLRQFEHGWGKEGGLVVTEPFDDDGLTMMGKKNHRLRILLYWNLVSYRVCIESLKLWIRLNISPIICCIIFSFLRRYMLQILDIEAYFQKLLSYINRGMWRWIWPTLYGLVKIPDSLSFSIGHVFIWDYLQFREQNLRLLSWQINAHLT